MILEALTVVHQYSTAATAEVPAMFHVHVSITKNDQITMILIFKLQHLRLRT